METFANRLTTLTDEELDMLHKIVCLGRQCAIDEHDKVRFGFFLRDAVAPEILGVFQSYLELFLSLVYNRLQNNLNVSTALSGKLETGQAILVSRIKEYFTEHVQENVTLEKLSAHFFLSPSYIKRVFKSETGQGAIAFFSKMKISEAKKLILDSQMSFQEIADWLSYNSPAHFSSVFKKYTGRTPSEYKKQHSTISTHSYRSFASL